MARCWRTLEPAPPVSNRIVVAKSPIVALLDVLPLAVLTTGDHTAERLVSSPFLSLHLPANIYWTSVTLDGQVLPDLAQDSLQIRPLILLKDHLKAAMVGDHVQRKLLVAALTLQALPASLVVALVPESMFSFAELYALQAAGTPVGSAIFINSLTTVNIVRTSGDVFKDSSLVVDMLTIVPNQLLQIFGAEGDNMKKT